MKEDEPLDAEIVEIVDEEPVTQVPAGDYNEAGVPSFDYVRERIETRIGAAELSQESPQSLSVEEQLAERDRAGREKLEEIRRSMRGD